jgi:hypothetical protein
LASSERRPEQSEGPASPAPALTPAQRALATARDLAPWFEDPIPHECPLCGSDKIIQRSCKVLCGTCRSIIQSCADL